MGIANPDEAPVGFLRSSATPATFWRNFHTRQGPPALQRRWWRHTGGIRAACKWRAASCTASLLQGVGAAVAFVYNTTSGLVCPRCCSWSRWLRQYIYSPLGRTPAALVLTMAASTLLHGTHRCIDGREVWHATVHPVQSPPMQSMCHACFFQPAGLTCPPWHPLCRAWLVWGAIQCCALLAERLLAPRQWLLPRLHPHLRAALVQAATQTTLLVQARPGQKGVGGAA